MYRGAQDTPEKQSLPYADLPHHQLEKRYDYACHYYCYYPNGCYWYDCCSLL